MFGDIILILGKFVIKSVSGLGYFGVILMMAIESAAVPLPSEVIMPFAGFLISQGKMTLLGATIAGAFGSLVGSAILYWIGYYGGRPLVERYGKYVFISKHDMEKSDNFFNRYGSGAIFFSRMMPIVRTYISLPAGIARMNFKNFTVYTFLGSVPWCFALAYIGKFLGDNWNSLEGYFRKFDYAVLAVIVVLVILFIKKHLKK